MQFIILISIIYGAPFLLLILAVNWVLNKEGKKKLAQRVLRYGVLLFFLAITFFSIIDWKQRRHIVEFELGNQYLLEIIATEQPGFMDTPVNFFLKIEIQETEKIGTFEFTCGEGPTLQFITLQDRPNDILIHGVNYNAGTERMIDMQSLKMNYSSVSYDDSLVNAINIVELSYDYQLTKIK